MPGLLTDWCWDKWSWLMTGFWANPGALDTITHSATECDKCKWVKRYVSFKVVLYTMCSMFKHQIKNVLQINCYISIFVQQTTLLRKRSLVTVRLQRKEDLYPMCVCVVGCMAIKRRLSGAHCSDRCEGSQREVWDKIKDRAGKEMSDFFPPLLPPSPLSWCSPFILCLLVRSSTLFLLHMPLIASLAHRLSYFLHRCRTVNSCLSPILCFRGDSGICGTLPSCRQVWLREATVLFQTC